MIRRLSLMLAPRRLSRRRTTLLSLLNFPREFRMETKEPVKSLHEELTCVGCAKIYLYPYLLPCQDTVCEGCLEKMKRDASVDSEGKVIRCPICSTQFYFQNTENIVFPENFLIKNILARYRRRSSNTQFLDLQMMPKEKQVFCQICEQKFPERIVKKCITCNLNYCFRCLHKIHGSKAFLSHRLADPTDDFMNEKKCFLHSNRDIIRYCVTDEVLVCEECLRTSHKGHFSYSLQEAFQIEAKELSEVVAQFRRVKQKCEKNIKQLKELKESLSMTEADVNQKIFKAFLSIHEALKSQEEKILQFIRRERVKKERSIIRFIDEASKWVIKMEGLDKLASEAFRESSLIAFLQTSNLIQKRIKISTAKLIEPNDALTKNTLEGFFLDLGSVRDGIKSIHLKFYENYIETLNFEDTEGDHWYNFSRNGFNRSSASNNDNGFYSKSYSFRGPFKVHASTSTQDVRCDDSEQFISYEDPTIQTKNDPIKLFGTLPNQNTENFQGIQNYQQLYDNTVEEEGIHSVFSQWDYPRLENTGKCNASTNTYIADAAKHRSILSDNNCPVQVKLLPHGILPNRISENVRDIHSYRQPCDSSFNEHIAISPSGAHLGYYSIGQVMASASPRITDHVEYGPYPPKAKSSISQIKELPINTVPNRISDEDENGYYTCDSQWPQDSGSNERTGISSLLKYSNVRDFPKVSVSTSIRSIDLTKYPPYITQDDSSIIQIKYVSKATDTKDTEDSYQCSCNDTFKEHTATTLQKHPSLKNIQKANASTSTHGCDIVVYKPCLSQTERKTTFLMTKSSSSSDDLYSKRNKTSSSLERKQQREFRRCRQSPSTPYISKNTYNCETQTKQRPKSLPTAHASQFANSKRERRIKENMDDYVIEKTIEWKSYSASDSFSFSDPEVVKKPTHYDHNVEGNNFNSSESLEVSDTEVPESPTDCENTVENTSSTNESFLFSDVEAAVPPPHYKYNIESITCLNSECSGVSNTEVPGPPVIYEHSVEGNTAKVSWTYHKEDEEQDFFEVQLQQIISTDSDSSIPLEQSGLFSGIKQDYFIAANLSPNTEYLFRVRAVNAFGPGQWGEPYKLITMCNKIKSDKGKFARKPIRVTVRRQHSTHTGTQEITPNNLLL
ncbi:uncharacterized protein LOC102350171 isoform X2 [Latimeria chalumnae]|uniref:uncharacterized protein LOC102350171 isoform X2 n=1 Tax=Latimeria chalumnae TaxID=7897 RepID=UPI0006D90250|nr:PREDICTED: uncharacterized protein LOC102350171 isoform X2 [Latimeria chalumnae]|eukprot:XP_014342170.1 PREDICTED: uncharacterized protein LOC102350171 isoform X2 [Latimeria chalumnae]